MLRIHWSHSTQRYRICDGRYFNPPDQDGEVYEGERSFSALKKFAKSLGPMCSVNSLAKCSKKQRAELQVDASAAKPCTSVIASCPR